MIASYASGADRTPRLDFHGFMFRDVTLRMLIANLIGPETHRRGEAVLTDWLEAGVLSHAVVRVGGLEETASALARVETGDKMGSVVLSL